MKFKTIMKNEFKKMWDAGYVLNESRADGCYMKVEKIGARYVRDLGICGKCNDMRHFKARNLDELIGSVIDMVGGPRALDIVSQWNKENGSGKKM